MKNNICLITLLLIFIPVLSFSQDKIDVLILNKNYKQALIELDKKITKSPNAALYFKQGMIFQSLQDYQGAVHSFTQGLQFEPNNVDLLSETAECFSILGNTPDAISFYTKACKLAPDNLTMAGKLGRVHINLKDYKKAYEVFTGIYEKDSTNVYWNKQLAYCSFRVFEREQARDLYIKVLEANPRDYGSYSNLIHCYNWKKEGDEILATIDSGLVQFPNDAELLYERAMYYFRIKDYELATENFEKYMEVEKEPPYETMMNIGISTYFANYVEKAMDIFNDMQRLNPNDGIVMYYQSLCFKKMKNFEDAEKYMQWAIEASIPTYTAEMYHHLGQIYGQQRKFKESVEALEKSYELNPGNHEILFEIATTYEEYNSNKTLAMNYYRVYLKEAGETAKNVNYALDRIEKLKEDLFFDE